MIHQRRQEQTEKIFFFHRVPMLRYPRHHPVPTDETSVRAQRAVHDQEQQKPAQISQTNRLVHHRAVMIKLTHSSIGHRVPLAPRRDVDIQRSTGFAFLVE